jgi:hypothetical protein
VTHSISRRSLMKGSLLACALTSTVARLVDVAEAETLTPLDPSDSNAKALSFSPDAAKMDAHAAPTYQAGQRCAGCIHYKDKATAPVAACETFPGHSVPAGGWCMVWSARAS